MKKKNLFKLFAILSVGILCACGESSVSTISTTNASTPLIPQQVEIKNPFQVETAVENGYTVDTETNTYTFIKAGEYSVSGDLNGRLVFADTLKEKVTLNLCGVNIESSESIIEWKSEDKKIEIKAKSGFVNKLITTESTAENSTISSNNNIEIGGKGELTIINNQKHGISGSDISIGSEVKLSITSTKKDGIHAKSILVEGGTISIQAKGDAIQAELNKKNAKGTIEVTKGNFTFNNCASGFRADTSVSFSGAEEIQISMNNVALPFDCTNVSSTANNITYKVNGENKSLPL